MKTAPNAHPVDLLDQLPQSPVEATAAPGHAPPTPADVLAFVRERRAMRVIVARWGNQGWTAAILQELMDAGLVRRAPRGNTQAYIATDSGRRALASIEVRRLTATLGELGPVAPPAPPGPGPVEWTDPATGIKRPRYEIICGCGFVARCDPLPDRIAALDAAGCPRCGMDWRRGEPPDGPDHSAPGETVARPPSPPPSQVRCTSAPDPDFDVFAPLDEDAILARLPQDARGTEHLAMLDEAVASVASGSTHRVYQTCMRGFATWCASHQVRSVPAHPEVVLLYLRRLALAQRSLSTIEVTHSAIQALHRARQLPGPSSTRLRDALKAMRRSMAKPGATSGWMELPVLRAIIAACSGDLLAKRDRALLLVTFFGRLRRPETVALDVEAVRRQPGSVGLRLPRCGAFLPLRQHRESNLCPVRALEHWLAERALHAVAPLSGDAGPLFVAVHRGAQGSLLLGQRLVPHDVDRVLDLRAERAGLTGSYSSRVLRAQPDAPETRLARGAR
jgi:hypothetical protein